MSELRECWRCGSVARLDGPFSDVRWVRCIECGAESRVFASDEEAIAWWNTRPASRVVEAAKKFLRCVEEYHDAIKLRDDLENRHLWSRELSAMYDATVTLRAALAPEGEEG